MNNRESSESKSANMDMIVKRICQILAPTLACCLYVITLASILANKVVPERVLERTWEQLGVVDVISSVMMVIIFLGLLGVITILILFVLWMQWQSYLIYYFYIASLAIMTVITPMFIKELTESLNYSLDIITLVIFMWNFIIMGMMSIFGLYAPGPLIVQQMYLIHNASLMALVVASALPGWAPWLLLVLLVIWDLFAVLAPYGPLNLIINLAEKRGVIDMPGLIYTTDPKSQSQSNSKSKSGSRQENKVNQSAKELFPNQNIDEKQNEQEKSVDLQQYQSEQARQQQEEEDSKSESSTQVASNNQASFEERGINMGLGDFSFFGLMVAITCRDKKGKDLLTSLAVIESLLMGIIITLLILAIARRALPALPIPILLALLVAPIASRFVDPLVNSLGSTQIFI